MESEKPKNGTKTEIVENLTEEEIKERELYTVKLEWYEVGHAAYVGSTRQIESLKKEDKDAKGFNGHYGYQRSMEGANGECAFAKFSNFYWQCSINTYGDGGDVGDIEIKTIGLQHHKLIVSESDPIDKTYVLMVGKKGKLRVAGWARGKDVRNPKWRTICKDSDGKDRPPAYFVPQYALRDIDELIEIKLLEQLEKVRERRRQRALLRQSAREKSGKKY